MAKEVMDRRSSDNKYLHRDFHGSMNFGVNYVGKTYGEAGVREYLADFARTYHLPLIEKIKQTGLDAIEDYLKEIYEIEEASEVLKLRREKNRLYVEIEKCPAVTYFIEHNIEPSPWFVETTKTVWQTIAEQAGIRFKLTAYDSPTGQASYWFSA